MIYPLNAGARPGMRGIYFPLGLGYITAVLNESCHVAVHDFNYDHCIGRRIDSEYVEQILKRNLYDFLMVGGVFPRFTFIKELIRLSRKICRATIIIGGSYLEPVIDTVMPYLEADYYVLGEGESTTPELIDRLVAEESVNDMKGIAFLEGGENRINQSPPPIIDLDVIPFPAREKWLFDRYKRYFAIGFPLAYTAHLISSRGCPLNCIFCRPAFGKIVRRRSPENIFEEMKSVESDYGCRIIYFHDEVLLGGKKSYVQEFCEYLLKKGKKQFCWAGTTNARFLDTETIRLMGRAGCIRLSLGVESGSQTILEEMRKNNDLHQIKMVMEDCLNEGIEIDFSLLTNTFSESVSTLNETKTFLSPLMKNYFRSPPVINYITPIPGTEIYDKAKRKGVLDTEDIKNMICLDKTSRYDLRWNLTAMDTLRFISTVNTINRELSETYYRHHRLQGLVKKYTNLTHFRVLETLRRLSFFDFKSYIEGLLWTISEGDEKNPFGRLFRKIVHGES